MDVNRDKKIIKLLSNHPEGLTIEEISKNIKMTRQTITKDLERLVATKKIKRREVGRAKLHYHPKHRK